MRLRATGEVFGSLPGLTLVVIVADGLSTPADAGAVTALWRQAWRSAEDHRRFENAQSHPHIEPWRIAFHRLGVSGKRFPTSIEALLRRAMKGGEPFSIHPLVDFYNAVSLTHLVPAGGFDLDDLDGEEITLRLSRPGDTFAALDDSEPAAIPAGELSYAAGSEVLTRHLVWRQARRGLIQPGTRRAVFVSEILRQLPEEVADAVLEALEFGLRNHFGASTSSSRLTAERPAFSW